LVQVLTERELADTIEDVLGPDFVALFHDADVTELYVNPDGRVRTTRYSSRRTRENLRLDAKHVRQFVNAVASQLGEALTARNPSLTAELPRDRFRGSRLEAEVPPIVSAPTFNLRKPPMRVIRLSEYEERGVISPFGHQVIREHVARGSNILVAGVTGSGKTTLANAILHQMYEDDPSQRFVILEDTVELLYEADDVLALRVRPGWPMRRLVRKAMRKMPDRIIVGEVTDREALHFLDAVRSHPGGLCTLHATNPDRALRHLDALAQRARVLSQRYEIADLINLVVIIQNKGNGRRVTDLAAVRGLDERDRFITEPLLTAA
jgi:P-type conjugative transfer ATPase TrbB